MTGRFQSSALAIAWSGGVVAEHAGILHTIQMMFLPFGIALPTGVVLVIFAGRVCSSANILLAEALAEEAAVVPPAVLADVAVSARSAPTARAAAPTRKLRILTTTILLV